MNDQALIHFLKAHQFNFHIHKHEPVFTVAEGMHLTEIIPGPHCKSLFLKDQKNSYFLLSLQDSKRVDLKALALIFATGRLSFGKPHDLLEKLQLTPGSVTPYGLLFDTHQQVSFFIDEDLLTFDVTNFHPMRNDMTLSMPTADFLRFFEVINHPPCIVKIPTV
jgi:Ala-tRNA(Pro) deacylase